MNKVLHILPMNKLSGAEKMVLILCKNMSEYEPVVVCGGENLKQIFEKNQIQSYALTFSNKKLLSTLNSLSKIIKENDIKIIHAHDNNASLNAYLIKKLYRLDIKIISHIHSCYPFLKENGFYKWIDSVLRSKYDYNIACGRLVYDFYNENAKYFPKEKTDILSNSIDIDEILKVDKKESEKFKKQFNIPDDKVILGFVGRICRIKGIVPFIKEIVKYKDEFKDCKILLIGSGEQEEEVKEMIKRLNLESLFILTGFQENVYKFYPLIDVFFLPSRYEGLPMVILEAMAFNKPIISMDVGSVNEVVKENKTGYLIDKENYSDFIIKLKEIKSQEQVRKEFGKNAFNYINENYNIKEYCKKLNKLYNSIICK